MGHDHGIEKMNDKKLIVSVWINVLLTVAQVIGGMVAGSLSLIADALHNLSDALALFIALFARKISRKPADEYKTFGYKRAEVIAALINLVTLVIIGLYLIYEATIRFFAPEEIQGWIVVIVATVALIIDMAIVALTYSMSKDSMNVKAAFIHNLTDALASLGVIIAGTFIILYQWYWMDALITLIIAGYVLWQGITMLPETIHLLMDGTPKHLSVEKVVKSLEATKGVKSVHHVHVWQLDERQNAMEAHVVTVKDQLKDIEKIKTLIKKMLHEKYSIEHSTLEFEHPSLSDCNDKG